MLYKYYFDLNQNKSLPTYYLNFFYFKHLLLILLIGFSCFLRAEILPSFNEFFYKNQVVMLVIAVENGQIMVANQAASTFYGYSIAQLKQKTIQDLNILSNREIIIERQQATLEQRNFFIFQHRLHNQQIKTVAVYNSPLIYQGKKAIHSIVFDISPQHYYDKALICHAQADLEDTQTCQMDIIYKNSQAKIVMLTEWLILFAILIVLLIYNLFKRYISETKLKKSRAQYLYLINGLQEHFFYSHDLKGIFTNVSPSIQDILGYSPKEFLTHFTEYLTDSPLNKAVESYTELTMSGKQQKPYLVEIYHKNGDIKILEVVEAPAFNAQGKIIGVEGIAQDITQRQAIAEKLRKKQADLAKAQEIAHLGSWRLDLKKNKLYWSDEIFRIFGLDPRYFNATYETFIATIHPDDRNYVNTQYTQSLTGELSYDIEHRIIRKDDNSVRWVHEMCEHIRDEKGVLIYSNGTVQDITERKQSEIALQEERLHLDEIVWAANVGTWEWHIPSDKIKINQRCANIMGYELSELDLNHMHIFLKYCHPDDQNRFQYLLKHYFANEFDHFEIEMRMCHKQGHWVWILDRGKIVERSETGDPLRMSGTYTDISERKHNENIILQLSKQKQLILNCTGDGICGINLQGNITFINPAALRMLGYENDELIGQSLYIILESKNKGMRDIRRKCLIFSTLKTGKIHRIDNEIFWRKDGSRFHVEYISTPIQENNAFMGTVITFRDITERKKQEKEIKYLATTDHLSGLYNRAEFDKQLKNKFKTAQQKQQQLALFILDLDRFKLVNDSYGHPIGDILLQQIAYELRDSCQKYHIVARLGGDEFAIIFTHLQNMEAAEQLAQTIVQRCQKKRIIEQHTVQVGISIGISLYPHHAKTINELIRTADKALYQAKSDGRNTYRISHFSL